MERIAEANDALMISGWACCKLSTGIMCGSSTPHRSRITGGKGSSRVTIVFEPGRRRHHGQGALASVSAAIIALGNGVVVGTVTKHWSFVWTLLALFPLLTDFISFYDSLKLTPDQLSPTPVLPVLSGPLFTQQPG
jgi:hypothetical protein